MRLLVIGGTRFLGRAIATEAMARGHRLTLFHRGKSNPGFLPEAEHLIGDREHDLHLLENREWDAVIDTCGFFPRVVGLSAQGLQERVRQYVFISSISVYSDLSQPVDEGSEVGTLADPSVEEITGVTYGPLKAACEEVVQSWFGDKALVVRPGLIVGPYDASDRFTYWPVRMNYGGIVIAPDVKEQPVQFIDVRDLGLWCVKMCERNHNGVFNATGPRSPMRLEDFLNGVRKAVNPYADLRWLPAELFEKENVEPWSDMPVVLPYDGSADNMSRASVTKAVAAGLDFRPLEQTARDTLVWWQQSGESELKAGLSLERQTAVLKAFNDEAEVAAG